MKKFALKATVAATALLAAGFASAGVFTGATGATYPAAPITALDVTNYAREALKADTAVTAADIAVVFNGFKLTAGVPYRVVLEVAGADFASSGNVITDAYGETPFVVGPPSSGTKVTCVPVTFSGQTASQLAFECTADADEKIGLSFATGALKLTNHTLHSGGKITIKAELQSREGFAIYDKVDATDYMAGVQAVTITAANDINTKANVKADDGPLFGFVDDSTAPADDATNAAAQFIVSNNVAALQAICPEVTATTFDMNNACGAYTPTAALKFTLKDSRSFAALEAGGLKATVGTSSGPAIGTFVPVGDTATLTVTPASSTTVPTPGPFAAAGSPTTVVVKYKASGTASLGSDRTIGFSGDINGGGQAFNSSNNSWWTWGNNGIILKFPAINQSDKTSNYVELLNTSSKDASLITAECFANKTNAVVGMKDKELVANQSLIVDLKYLCPGMDKVNSVVLTVAAPTGDVTATAISRHKTTGAVSYVNAATGNN